MDRCREIWRENQMFGLVEYDNKATTSLKIAIFVLKLTTRVISIEYLCNTRVRAGKYFFIVIKNR